MPFPTEPNMDVNQYKASIIDHYWPGLDKVIASNIYVKATNKARLPDDYAEIGAFLTSKDRVYQALAPLERDIRKKLMSMGELYRSKFPRTVGEALKYTHKDAPSSTAAGFKSHKLLTNALRAMEAEGGFNHERIVNGTFFADAIDNTTGTLHAGGGMSDGLGRLKSPGTFRNEKDEVKQNVVPLPRGVPTIAGTLDPSAFNSVLLRHGYQFKDVAAGPYHGEYTHRLQWYAIMRAKASNTLALANTPLEIFKSLGYMVAKAPGNTDDPKLKPGNKALYIDERGNHRHLYMWEALFDTAEGEIRARNLRTLAYTESGLVFACPESFNRSLMKLDQYTDNEKDLWCIRVLLATRWKKRYDMSINKRPGLSPLAKVRNALEWEETRAVISSVSRKDAIFSPALPPAKEFKAGPVVTTSLSLAEQLAAKKATVEGAGKRAHAIPENRRDEDKTFTNFQDAGYALAWFLQNDTVE